MSKKDKIIDKLLIFGIFISSLCILILIIMLIFGLGNFEYDNVRYDANKYIDFNRRDELSDNLKKYIKNFNHISDLTVLPNTISGDKINGAYTGNTIFLNKSLSDSDTNKTFTHEYSHHIIQTSGLKYKYVKDDMGIKEEKFTDILAYYLSKNKGLKYNSPSYLSRLGIILMYNFNNKIKNDVDNLIEYENTVVKTITIHP